LIRWSHSSIPASKLTTFDYDPRNRVLHQYEPAGTDSVTTTYDSDGRVKTIATPITSWSYYYDQRGLLETQSLTANGGVFTIADQYDPQGHVGQRTYPDGLVNSYSPDAWGKPTQVGSFVSAASYAPNGALATFNYGNGISYSQSLDGRLRPFVIQANGGTAGTVESLKYTYDNDNNVKVITDSATGAQSRSLFYDGLDRLTTASGVWGSATYGYDSLDNLRTETIGAQTINTNYNANTNRIDGVSGSISRAYGYDAQGNLRANGVNSFLFDVANRLVQTAGVASYRYDGNGRRTISIESGGTEYAVYDVSGDLVHTFSTTGCVTTDFLSLDHKLIAQTSAGATTYLHTDELGSPIAATNGSGALLWNEEYQPYGMKLNGVSEKIGFTGHVFDADTGLTDVQARLYDPLIGRFLSTDPKGFNSSSAFSFNRYAYANDNPYRYKDPDGKIGIDIVFVAYDLYELATEGATLTNVVALGLDTASTFGAGFGLGEAYRAVKGAERLAEGATKAAEGVKVAEKAESVEKGEKTYQTYTKTNPETGEVYSGRTSGTGTPEENVATRDAGHHKNAEGFGPAKLDKSSANKDAIRGREQQLIDANGGAKSQGGTSGNAINGVSPTNPNAERYEDAARSEFERNNPQS
jgi:RHS repeat-associated protein